MARVTTWITRGLPLWALSGALAAYLWPDAFAWTEWRITYLLGGFLFGVEPAHSPDPYNLPGQPLFTCAFALTMFAVGTVIEPRNFVFLARQPRTVVAGLATQFTVMPTLGYLTAQGAGFDPELALGFILVGCAPGAMTSNVLTYLARGDTAYSVTLTTLASILAVVVTPSLIQVLAGEEMGVTTAQFWSQLWTIAWSVAAPLILGLMLRAGLARGRRLYETLSPSVAVAAIVLICCYVIRRTHDDLAQVTAPILAGVALLNGMGFLLGGLLARLYRLPGPQRVTLAIEIGMQNAGMGVVLAATSFAPRVAIPAALFTIWCILTASALIAILRRRGVAEISTGDARLVPP